MRTRATLALFLCACTATRSQPHPAHEPSPGAAEAPQAVEIPAHKNAAVVPVSRSAEAWWQERFEAANARAKQGGVDLVFLGDSITQGWESEGRDAWARYYGTRNAVNLGFSGDRTQHLLWRIQNGNVAGLEPKLAVVMIGTNNSNGEDHTAEEIADGIRAVVGELRARLPKTKLLLLGVFPRGEHPEPQRSKLERVNRIVRELDDGELVRFLDLGPRFLLPDGSISKEVMPDFLHLSATGYEIWASAIEPAVHEMMQAP
jgi:lysophospholipase L1-like esterase